MTEALKLTSTTGIFAFTGIESVGHLLYGSVPSAGEEALKQILIDVKQQVSKLF